MNFRFFKIFLFLIFSYFSVSAQTGFKAMKDTAAFKQSLNTLNQSITTIKSDFIQEKNISIIEDKIISKGKFYFSKPGLLRWEYSVPVNYIVVLNGKKLFIKDNQKVSRFSLQSNKVFQQLNDVITGCIEGAILNSKDYKFSYKENDRQYLVCLVPLSSGMAKVLSSISIYFERSDLSVSRLEMSEVSGDNTVILFTNRKLNEKIPPDIFTVK
jgi:outer membrane lipoprotein-sorting protein